MANEAVRDGESSREEERPLESIPLGIGDAIHLQSQRDGDPVRHTVRLIGYLRGKGLIVTTPTVDGKVLMIRDGQNYVVRLFAGRSAYAFSTTVFKVANVPYPHLHLTWPSHVKGLTVRKGARAKVSLIASITCADGTARSGLVEDLSVGGCSLTSREALGMVGDTVRLKFRVLLGGLEQYFDLPGTLRSITPTMEDATPRIVHGLAFNEVSPQDTMGLTACVYHTLFEESERA